MTQNRPSLPRFVTALNDSAVSSLDTLKTGRETLKQFADYQFAQFEQGVAVAELIKERATFIDQLLKKIWHHYIPKEAATLVAVGGYGRGELQPYSDIDVLILVNDTCNHQEAFSDFITFLWDLGFDVGHAMRTLNDCVKAGLEDVATATNLLEARWIAGDYSLFEKLQNIWNQTDFWPSQEFFKAKYQEQLNRHARFNETVYQLEPNIKESPGGLRDIQTIYWVAKRHFKAHSINELVQRNFLTMEEYLDIEAAYKFLNRIRFALHLMKKRREDRLQFEQQQFIAHLFGYTDTAEKMAVEQFMSSYYRNVQNVVKMNEILLQHFREVLFDQEPPSITPINSRFQLVNHYLDIHSVDVFIHYPTALLEVFLILENADHIHGLRSNAIRTIRDHLYLIDDSFRNDPINKALFMEIFRQPKGVNAALKRMHSYGILGEYLPVFKKITGLMQFNIFHAYTVDDHTILTIRNLRRFFVDTFTYEFPTAHQIAQNLCKPELLFLAGLFHDIAKGRGGAHEILGALDAAEFAAQHHLSNKDGALISWLVRHHLEFSGVAQRKDLSDPNVIRRFAEKMGDQEHLDYLYLLTVADVCATSSEVWNDWKNSLFLDLYNETTTALSQTASIPKDKSKKALQTQEKAKELLSQRGLASPAYQAFWNSLVSSEFFSRHNASDVARITTTLYQAELSKTHLFLDDKCQRGAAELLIYMPDRDYLFAQITQILDKLNVNVVEARIYATTKGMTLVMMYFLSRDKLTEIHTDHLHILREIETQLRDPEIKPSGLYNPIKARRIKHFDTPTQITFSDINEHLTELSICTKDIPGLLSKIGYALKSCNIRLHDAKIHTEGEKAEDVFLISDIHNNAISQKQAKGALTEALLDLIEKT
ncbi:[protein-PII] uridylyltransferase [Thiomicrorhabdus aquaedulcis]|uniref:[protein-PII] uridylyltransferase n=1 Tax=Thiomicrorhabdus aquaedulcis TaxID=2211106 RepID=UPI000FD6D5EA|nr:[protein-PII] uridylyltransferase [Thiomicrorhabdus aquaedulcis]